MNHKFHTFILDRTALTCNFTLRGLPGIFCLNFGDFRQEMRRRDRCGLPLSKFLKIWTKNYKESQSAFHEVIGNVYLNINA